MNTGGYKKRLQSTVVISLITKFNKILLITDDGFEKDLKSLMKPGVRQFDASILDKFFFEVKEVVLVF